MTYSRSVFVRGVGGGLAIIGLLCHGCGATGGGGAGGGGGDPTGSKALTVDFDDDPTSELVASAQAEDGSEMAIYGDKDAAGNLTNVTQIDVTGSSGGTVTSIALDDEERPVHMDVGTTTDATFAYDDDAGTVRVEVEESTGASAVGESFGVLGEEEAGKARPSKATAKTTVEALCMGLKASRDVLKEFFDCDDADSIFCKKASSRVPELLKALCEAELNEVDDLSLSLGDTPEDIPLGIEGHFTTRGAAGTGTTVVLSAVAFGGVHPYASVSWSLLPGGPGEVSIESLPGGTAIADLLIPGRYTFRAEVTDAEGDQAVADIEVSPESLPAPSIVFSPESPELGQVVNFSGADSEVPGDDPIKFYHWRFGDEFANTGVDVGHAYTEEGEFIVSLLISTEAGRRATATVVVRVGEGLDCEQECQDEAEGLFLDCLLSGGFEDECAARSHEMLKECVEDLCGGSLNCETHCEEQAEHEFDRCRDEGGTEEDCEPLFFDIMNLCLREQCASMPECEKQCHHEAEGNFFDCRGNGNSEEECIEETRTKFDMCLNANCDQFADCDEHCIERAERVFEECRHNGGNEEECAFRAQEHVERCFEEECFKQGNCEELCEEHSEQVFRECIADGGTQDHCDDRSSEFFEICIHEECEGPESCEQMCDDEAWRFFEHCLDSGGTENECEIEAFNFMDICLREACQELPDCEFLCHERVMHDFEQCLFMTGDEVRCMAEAEGQLEGCLRDECAGEAYLCEDQCWQHGDQVFDRCLMEGGSDDQCWMEAEHVVGECLFDQCGQAPGCEQHCAELAEDAFLRCSNAGGDVGTTSAATSEDECGNVSFEVFDMCMFEDCDTDQLPDCEAFCDEQAGWAFEDCLFFGGTEDECIGLARDVFDTCASEECGLSDGHDCEDFCFEHADTVFFECLIDGGTDEECGQMAGELFDICLAEECGIQPPPPPDDCEGFCFQQAEFVFDDCMAGGGFFDECDRRADSAFDMCMAEECRDEPPPPPDDCAGLCRQEADGAFDDCMASGGSSDECDRHANDTFEMCMASECDAPPPPPPPDDCEGFCNQEADFVFNDCLVGGGMQDECARIADEEFNFCLAVECFEEEPPPPDCEGMCADEARFEFDACISGDGLPEDCASIEQQAFEACLSRECTETAPM